MATCHCDGPPHTYEPSWCLAGRGDNGRPINPAYAQSGQPQAGVYQQPFVPAPQPLPPQRIIVEHRHVTPAPVEKPSLAVAIGRVQHALESLQHYDSATRGPAYEAALQVVLEAAQAQETQRWHYSVKNAEGKIYYPRLEGDLQPGSTLLRQRPASEWEAAPEQDFTKLNLLPDVYHDSTRTHEAGFTYESWRVGTLWEYRIVGTPLVVKSNNDYREYGLLHEAFCGAGDWEHLATQVTPDTLLREAWAHWTAVHAPAAAAG